MANKAAEAKKTFVKGYNCAQSVLMTFCEDLGLDRDTAAKLAYGLGGGIARSRETCGAVLGGIMVLGLTKSAGGFEDKEEMYKEARSFMDEFRKEAGSVTCRELLGLPKGQQDDAVPEKRTAEYYSTRPCEELVALAAKLLEKHLKANE